MPLAIMQKDWVALNKQALLLAAFLAACVAVLAMQPALAGSGIPVPAHKPERAQVIRYSLKDFAKALFGDEAGAPGDTSATKSYDGPLTDADAARYRRIFTLQEAGKIKEADRDLAALGDARLRGHVLYQRYMHPTAYKSNFEELQNWLALYNDHPGAAKIYSLAQKKNTGGADLKKPQSAKGITSMREPMMTPAKVYKSPAKRDEGAAKTIKNSVQSLISRSRLQDAFKKLQSSEAQKLDQVERDILQAQISASYMYQGKTAEAYKLASAAADRSGIKAPMAGWVAGLISWQEGKYKRAAKFFEMPASSPYSSSWTAAAGSYWAARAHMRTGNVKAVSTWLQKAVDHPRTFYGLVATRALGQDFEFNWHVPTFTRQYHDILASVPAGQRAVALVAAGQTPLAETELLRINPGDDGELHDALLSFAAYSRMPALAMRLGSSGAKGVSYDAALYPTGSWKPKHGYKVDPALIYAIMRQESKFDPLATSPSGARGLMQLMPKTASAMAQKNGGGGEITDPETNLELGQKYIEVLMKDKYVKQDLLALLVAYNAGPGNLARWKKNWPDVEDPLLFIELIPSGETRAYVERVLANYWIYRLREGLPTPTLDAVAAGKAAKYAGFNEEHARAFVMAENTR